MNNNSFLENRAMRGFGVFMIFIYTILGILLLFVIDWPEVPKTNRIIIGVVLLLYAAFRTYMVRQHRKRLQQLHEDEKS